MPTSTGRGEELEQEAVTELLAKTLDRVLDGEARARERQTELLEGISQSQSLQVKLIERQTELLAKQERTLERIAELQDRGLIATLKGNRVARIGLFAGLITTLIGGLIWFALEVLPQVISWFSSQVSTFPSRMR